MILSFALNRFQTIKPSHLTLVTRNIDIGAVKTRMEHGKAQYHLQDTHDP